LTWQDRWGPDKLDLRRGPRTRWNSDAPRRLFEASGCRISLRGGPLSNAAARRAGHRPGAGEDEGPRHAARIRPIGRRLFNASAGADAGRRSETNPLPSRPLVSHRLVPRRQARRHGPSPLCRGTHRGGSEQDGRPHRPGEPLRSPPSPPHPRRRRRLPCQVRLSRLGLRRLGPLRRGALSRQGACGQRR
jgi:hypothetical protein